MCKEGVDGSSPSEGSTEPFTQIAPHSDLVIGESIGEYSPSRVAFIARVGSVEGRVRTPPRRRPSR